MAFCFEWPWQFYEYVSTKQAVSWPLVQSALNLAPQEELEDSTAVWNVNVAFIFLCKLQQAQISQDKPGSGPGHLEQSFQDLIGKSPEQSKVNPELPLLCSDLQSLQACTQVLHSIGSGSAVFYMVLRVDNRFTAAAVAVWKRFLLRLLRMKKLVAEFSRCVCVWVLCI